MKGIGLLDPYVFAPGLTLSFWQVFVSDANNREPTLAMAHICLWHLVKSF